MIFVVSETASQKFFYRGASGVGKFSSQLIRCNMMYTSLRVRVILGVCRVGQNRIFTYKHNVYLVISKPKIPYANRIYMVMANPRSKLVLA